MSSSNGTQFHQMNVQQQLRERLNEPDTAEALNQILDNIQLIALSVTSLDGMLRRSEQIIGNVTDGIQEIRAVAPSPDVNLTDVIAQLTQLSQLLPQLTQISGQLKSTFDSDEFKSLANSGVLAPKTLGIIGQAGSALVESYEASQQQAKPMGVLGLANSLRDPDVQRALTFLVGFSKRFGQALDN